MKRLGLFIIVLVGALQTACVSGPGVWVAPGGQVLEWPSQKPLAGVHVTGTWEGSEYLVFTSRTACYHVSAAVTDDEGYYRLSTYADVHPQISRRHITYKPYKAGYRESVDDQRYYRKRDGKLYLEVDPRQGAERLKYLSSLSGALWCGGGAEQSEGAAYPALKAVYEEAASIAVTEKDRQTVNYLKRKAARAYIFERHPAQTGPEASAREKLAEELASGELP
jgi:hypothetical protein